MTFFVSSSAAVSVQGNPDVYGGIVEGYYGTDTLSSELNEKFERYKTLAKKTNPSDEDYAEMTELEMYLDEVPDYLALDFATEYARLKLEVNS